MGNFYGVLAGLGWGFTDYYGGHASKKIDHVLLFLYTQAFSIIPFCLLLLVIDSEFTFQSLAWGIVSGIGILAGMLLFFEALASERMSIVTPVSGVFTAVVPVIYALTVENEQLSLLICVGIALSMAGVVLVSASTNVEFAPMTRRQESHHLRGIFISIISGMCFGITYVAIGAASSSSGMWPLIGARAVVPFVFVFALVKRPTVVLPVAQLRIPFVLMLFASGAFVLFRLGVEQGDLAVVSVLAAASPVFTAILAWVIDHEHRSRSQVVGVAIAGIGIMLLNT